jgi:hypothetical protein
MLLPNGGRVARRVTAQLKPRHYAQSRHICGQRSHMRMQRHRTETASSARDATRVSCMTSTSYMPMINNLAKQAVDHRILDPAHRRKPDEAGLRFRRVIYGKFVIYGRLIVDGCMKVPSRLRPSIAAGCAKSPRVGRSVTYGESVTYAENQRLTPAYIRNTPQRVSGIGALRAAENASASTRRVSCGAMMPSSQSRAVA